MSISSLPIPNTVSRTAGNSVMVKGFAHFGGHHCETSALQKVLAHAGIDHTEEFLFGMAGGVGFIFWQSATDSVPFVGGRNGKFPEFLIRLGEAIGQKVEVVKTSSERRAYQNLLAELQQDRPIVCYGDILYLPYFHSPRHFGGHAFVVYGIDEGRDEVWISDRSNQAQVISLAELARARASTTTVFPPKNSQLRVCIEPAAHLEEKTVRRAILGTCEAMLRPPIGNFGLRGLGKLIAYLTHALETLAPQQLCDLAVTTYVNLELAGTGGCAFRRMYRRFLAEVSQAFAIHSVEEAIPLLERSIAAWFRFIDGLLPTVGSSVVKLRSSLDGKEQAFERGGMEGLRLGNQFQLQAEALRAEASHELAEHRRQLLKSIDDIREIQTAEAACFEILERRLS